MNAADKVPLILYWQAEEAPVSVRGKAAIGSAFARLIELRDGTSPFPFFELRELGSPGDRMSPRALLREVAEISVSHAGRPICLVISADWSKIDFRFFDPSLFPLTGGESGYVPRGAKSHNNFEGLGGQLILKFPEIWPILSDFENVKIRDGLLKSLIIEAAKGANEGNTKLEDDARILTDALSLTIARCHTRSRNVRDTCPIEMFLRHRQFLFDPTGLRTLVKAQLWRNKAFNRNLAKNASPARIMLERAVNNSLVADEEFETAQSVAYGLYRQGRRCWSLVDGDDFLYGPWRSDGKSADERGSKMTSAIFRDLQLQLYTPDLVNVTLAQTDAVPAGSQIRLQDKTHWDTSTWDPQHPLSQKVKPISGWLSDGVQECVVTGNAIFQECSGAECVFKPLDSLFMPLSVTRNKIIAFGDTAGSPESPTATYRSPDTSLNQRSTTLIQRLVAVSRADPVIVAVDEPEGNAEKNRAGKSNEKILSIHSTTPIFYQLATSLLERSDELQGRGAHGYILRGILLQDAVELLAGLNFPTAIKAFSKLHTAEAGVEASALGTFSARIDIDERKREIEAVLISIFCSGGASPAAAYWRCHDHGLQIWAAISGAYRNHDAMSAANDAQVESLVYVGHERRQGRIRAWLVEFPISMLNFWLVLLSYYPHKSIGRFAAALVNMVPVRHRQVADGLRRSLRRKREAFKLLARPWSFVALYTKFISVWALYTTIYQVSPPDRNGSHLMWVGTFVQTYLVELFHSITAAVASELWLDQQFIDRAQSDPWAGIHLLVETIFLVSNFAFLTVLVAVLVKFILRD